jgi:GR25 family glycosyltransferase involved in LPS biosynthesis
MIDKLFDKVYVINLKESKDRLIQIKDQLEKIGLYDYTIWEAINGREENVKYKITEYNKEMEGWNIGSAGLVYTTISILKHAKINKYESILILEDDLIFDIDKLDYAVRGFKTVKSDWEMFHFTATHFKQPEKYNKFLYQVNGAWSCQMYAINSTAYDLYLKYLLRVDMPIDVITSYIFQPRGNVYSLRENLVITEANFSTIRNEYIDHLEFVEDVTKPKKKPKIEEMPVEIQEEIIEDTNPEKDFSSSGLQKVVDKLLKFIKF